MTKFSQRSTAVAVFLLLGLAVCWWLAEGETRHPPSPAPSNPPASFWSAGTFDRPPASPLAAQLAANFDDFREVTDRYADSPVLAQRQSARIEKGLTKITRVRLVRKDDFKYPIFRVEDELVSRTQGDRLIKQTAMVGDHVLVKLQDPTTTDAAFLAQLKDAGATIRRKMPASGTWLVAFANPTLDTVPEAMTRLSALKPMVRFAEPDFIVHALATPNDADFSSLWGMHNTGQNSGVDDVDIDAPEAWDLSTGSATVVVAVIDSGLDLTHPDLVDNLWSRPGEVPGNGQDDDGNGYVDDSRGWDFVNNDNNPADDNSHGTHCAGTIGGVGDNALGVSGVCWDVSLLGLKFLDAGGTGSLSDGVEAIAYATASGVTLTSNSWGGGGYSEAMEEAILEADAAGVLFVAAAGNDGANMESSPGYPASYSCDNVISVAAITRTDELASYSNFGATRTDLGAPGTDVYSTIPGGGYGAKSGTSMAAPHVAGACALLRSYRPELTSSQVKDLLLRSVDSTPALTGKTVSGGRLNLYNALLASGDILASPGTGLVASGAVGGPFVPENKTYTLTNHGNVVLDWAASASQSWVTLSVAGGTLAPAESIDVLVTLNAESVNLLPGSHAAAITFTSLATGRTQHRQVTVQVAPPVIYAFNLETDPGWARTGAWAYGPPSGQGGLLYGRADPVTGATGGKVFGVNLGGDYSTTVAPPQYLTAGPFDLSEHHSATLRFQRWLNSDYQTWVYATIEVSHDQIVWYPVWDNGTAIQIASQWTQVEYDLSDHADGQSQVYVRWGHEVRGQDAYPLSGWNLDDIEILAVPNHQIRLTLPASVTEGGASGIGKVAVAPVSLTDLTVTLTSDHPGMEVAFPATVTILAGQEEATFEISAIDDSRVDGTQTSVIIVNAPDFPSASDDILSHDNDAGILQVTLPESLPEGGISGPAGEVRLPTPAEADILISLASSDLSELLVPESVTILAGTTGAVFSLTSVDDSFIDGTQVVSVTASVVNWPAASASTQVLDDEPRILTLTLPGAAMESAGLLPGAGTVLLSFPTEAELAVNLASGDTGELTVPAQVIIPARSSSAIFDLVLQDDASANGAQAVQVSASAAGFAPAAAILTVNDDEFPALPVSPTPADGAYSMPPETDLAWQSDPGTGGVPDSYDVYFGTSPNFSAAELIGTTSTPARVLPRLSPSTTYFWQVVARKGAATRAGAVWCFFVAPVGPVTRFAWEPLPATVSVGVPFSARVTAFDEYDNPVTAFSDSATLTTLGGVPETTTGTGTLQWEFPFATYFHDARTQSIYLPAEVGPAGPLTSLALDVAVLPGQTMNNFTIRLKHTTKEGYSAGNLQNWESTGWTTVYQNTKTITSTGWNWSVFTTPFVYDGVSNLMVDISFNNYTYSVYGRSRASPVSNYRSLSHLTDSNYGDPLAWTGTMPFGTMSLALPNLRFRRSESSIPVSPAVIGPFVNGAWSGDITLVQPNNALSLVARLAANSAVSGVSTTFDVVAIPTLSLNAEPLFTGGFANSVSWTSLGAGFDYEIQRSSTATFTLPVSSGFISGTEHAFEDLADGQTYHYRGRVRVDGVAGAWSAVVRSTQDATPPTVAFTPASGGVVVADSLTLAGTGTDFSSGIATLRVDGAVAATSDGFSQWQWHVTGLQDGVTSLVITVQDQAVPPNSRTENWSVTRISNITADTDQNGLGALLEYAFSAAGHDAPAALPQIATATDPDTLQHWLTVSYRRRLNAAGLAYLVETSTNLAQWQPAGAAAETLSVTPTGDGMTEQVLLRVHPSPSQGQTFVRVRVTVP